MQKKPELNPFFLPVILAMAGGLAIVALAARPLNAWLNALPPRQRALIVFGVLLGLVFVMVACVLYENRIKPRRHMRELGRRIGLQNRSGFFGLPILAGNLQGRSVTISQHEISMGRNHTVIITRVALGLRAVPDLSFELESPAATGGTLVQNAMAMITEAVVGKLPRVESADEIFNRCWLIRGRPVAVLQEWLDEEVRSLIDSWRAGGPQRPALDFALQCDGEELELILGNAEPDLDSFPGRLRELIRLADALESAFQRAKMQ